MDIVIAADIAGFDLKEKVMAHLQEGGHRVLDVGMVDKNVFRWWYEGCEDAMQVLLSGRAALAILICGSGAGMAALANKHEGVLAVPCEGVFTARMAKQLLGANVLTMGGHVVGPGQAFAIADAFVDTKFAEGAAPERREYLEKQRERFREIDRSCFHGKG